MEPSMEPTIVYGFFIEYQEEFLMKLQKQDPTLQMPKSVAERVEFNRKTSAAFYAPLDGLLCCELCCFLYSNTGFVVGIEMIVEDYPYNGAPGFFSPPGEEMEEDLSIMKREYNIPSSKEAEFYYFYQIERSE